MTTAAVGTGGGCLPPLGKLDKGKNNKKQVNYILEGQKTGK